MKVKNRSLFIVPPFTTPPLSSARLPWAGCSFDLKTVTQTPEQVRHAVELVVSDPKYRKRVMEMKEEAENYDLLIKLQENQCVQIEPSLEVL